MAHYSSKKVRVFLFGAAFITCITTSHFKHNILSQTILSQSALASEMTADQLNANQLAFSGANFNANNTPTSHSVNQTSTLPSSNSQTPNTQATTHTNTSSKPKSKHTKAHHHTHHTYSTHKIVKKASVKTVQDAHQTVTQPHVNNVHTTNANAHIIKQNTPVAEPNHNARKIAFNTPPSEMIPDDDSDDTLVNKAPPKGWETHIVGIGPMEEIKREHKKPHPKPTEDSDRITNIKGEPSKGNVPHSQNRILIPVGAHMGIAGYQTGDKFIVIVDAQVPMDTSLLRGDGIFENVQLSSLPGFVMLTLPIPDTRQLYMSRQSDGWVLGDQAPPMSDYANRPTLNPIEMSGNILFPMKHAGRVLGLHDPVTNKKLIIGTTVYDDGGILSFRAGNDYDVLPSLEGIVIEPHGAPMELVPTDYGDLLKRMDDKPQNDLKKAVYASDVDFNWLGLRHNTPEEASERYKKALLEAADAPPKDKFDKRMNAAQAALGVADIKNARAIINVALEDDPEEITRPDVKFFLGAVNLLNNNPKEASELEHSPPETQERATQLWRGLYLAYIGKDHSEASKLISNDYMRLLNYPEGIRDYLLPFASEEIARYGTPAEKRVLSNMPDGEPYKFDRALIRLGAGDKDSAIHDLEELSMSPDIDTMEKALESGIALSLADGHISPQDAERQYASLLPEAKLLNREGQLFIFKAEADLKAQDYTNVLSSLDTASRTIQGHNNPRLEQLYKKALEALSKRLYATENQLSKSDIIHNAALISSHIEDMSESPEKVDMYVAYARSLERLGLNDQADDFYTKAIKLTDNLKQYDHDEQKANISDELAESLIKEGKFEQANTALDTAPDKSLSQEEQEKRNRILSHISIASGNDTLALILLNNSKDVDSKDLRARLHEQRGEWNLAVADMRDVVAQRVPDTGTLTTKQQTDVLRLASDASRASDQSTLYWLKEKVGNRSFDNNDGDLFGIFINNDDNQ